MWFCSVNRLLNCFTFIANKTPIATHLRLLSQNSGKQIESGIKFNGYETNFEQINSDSFSSLITDDHTKQRINHIINEYTRLKYMTDNAPDILTIDDMHRLMTLDDNERAAHYSYLYKRQCARTELKKNRKMISEKYWREQDEKFAVIGGPRSGIFDENGKLLYGLWHNTLFSKIHKTCIRKKRNNALRNAVIFGPKLIIDLGYDQYMNAEECVKLSRHIRDGYSFNKYETTEPFDIHFSDCNMSGQTIKEIESHMPICFRPNFYSPFHTKSYLELFPKEKLVYITRHAKEMIDWYDPNDIFIIPGFQDTRNRGPITHAKAINSGVRLYKLPIDKYLTRSNRFMFINMRNVIAILNEVKTHGNWGDAVRNNISEFIQKSTEEIAYEDEIRFRKLKTRNEKFYMSANRLVKPNFMR